MSQVEMARRIAHAAQEKKAQGVTILDIKGLCVFADYFVICHGTSHTQVQAITTAVKKKVSQLEVPLKGIEGYQDARWVLMDLGDVVVHIFHKDERDFYDLERLWGDAQSIQVQ